MKIQTIFNSSKLPAKISLYISVISNGIIYIVFLLGARAFSGNPLLFYSSLPAVLYLLIIPLSFPFVYQRFDSWRIEDRPFWKTWFTILILVLLFDIGLDFIFFYVADRSISMNYSKQLGLFMPGKSNQRMLKEFAELPFFIQNSYMNVIAVSIGVLLAVSLERKIKRKSVTLIKERT